MKLWSLVVALFVATVVWAGGFSPDMPLLGKLTFGYDGLAVLEVALPNELSYNPAAMPLAFDYFGKKVYAELDYGVLDFEAGPTVRNDWQVAAARLSRNAAVRVAHYGIGSSTSQTRIFGPYVGAEFSGDTYELAYGQRVGALSLGAAWMEETTTTGISLNGVPFADGKARSENHYRVGATYQLSKNLSVGGVYTNQKIRTNITLFEETVEPIPEELLNGRFHEQLYTFGAGWQPRLGTVLFYTRQMGDVNAPGYHIDLDSEAYGVRQYLNEHLALAVSRANGAESYEVNYSNNGWVIAASYSPKAFPATEEYLGRAETCYVWLGRSW